MANPAQAAARLGERLVASRIITPAQLAHALREQQIRGGRLGEVLVALGYVDEALVQRTVGGRVAPPPGRVVTIESLNPPPVLVRRMGEAVIRRHRVVPLAMSDGVLELAMVQPADAVAAEAARRMLSAGRVEARAVSPATFERFVRTRFASRPLVDGHSDAEVVHRIGHSRAMDDDEEADAPVVRLVDHILIRAVERRASDVHLEPFEAFFRVRYRVDGRLYTVLTPPQKLHSAVISRLKILSGMDISIRRKPQDGHVVLQVDHQDIHFRVSTLPTVFGEKCVVRILKKEAHLADLGRLGFSAEQLQAAHDAAALTQGLVLVTGPTGSGKTTTLHALINHINEPEVNIVTVEDPVESTIPGVSHVQVADKGVTFAAALRSILRQDPDVVFVGEMRDEEVARIALKASLTGHLVLSTLHTNGVVETMTRLADMNLEPYLVASSLRMVIAQRLLRVLCSCSRREAIPAEIAAGFALSGARAASGHRVAVGCERCMDTGYRGRVAVYEVLAPDDAVQELLRRRASELELREAADRLGVTRMRERGVELALAGRTSFEEVARVLGSG